MVNIQNILNNVADRQGKPAATNTGDLTKLQAAAQREMTSIAAAMEAAAGQIMDIRNDPEILDRAKPIKIDRVVQEVRKQKEAALKRISELAKDTLESSTVAARIAGIDKADAAVIAQQDISSRLPEELVELYEAAARDNDRVRMHHLRRLSEPVLARNDNLNARESFQAAVRRHRSDTEVTRDRAHAGANALLEEVKGFGFWADKELESVASGQFNGRTLTAAADVATRRSQEAAAEQE